MTQEQYKILILMRNEVERIKRQYFGRIEFIKRDRKIEELSQDEAEICIKLKRLAHKDPRRPDVWYFNDEAIPVSLEIAKKLNALTSMEFLTDPYVLKWEDEINSIIHKDAFLTNSVQIDGENFYLYTDSEKMFE